MSCTEEELKKHNIFRMFWNEDISKEIKGIIKLSFVPQEYVSFYQKQIEYDLKCVANVAPYDSLNAKAEFILTSLDPEIDIDNAIKHIDDANVREAVLVRVKLRDERNTVFITEFNVGSLEPEKIETDSSYLRLISELY